MPDVAHPPVVRRADGTLRWARYAAGEYLCGPWHAEREFYADGATLFDWVLTRETGDIWFSFRRLADIRVFVQTVEDRVGASLEAERLFFELVGDLPGQAPSATLVCDMVDAALGAV